VDGFPVARAKLLSSPFARECARREHTAGQDGKRPCAFGRVPRCAAMVLPADSERPIGERCALTTVALMRLPSEHARYVQIVPWHRVHSGPLSVPTVIAHAQG